MTCGFTCKRCKHVQSMNLWIHAIIGWDLTLLKVNELPSTIEHYLFHIVLQCWQGPDRSITTHPISATATEDTSASKSTCHWPSIWCLWVHVAPCPECSQVGIVGRRNCHNMEICVSVFWMHQKKNLLKTKRNGEQRCVCSPIETDRVHRAYLQIVKSQAQQP